MMVVASNTVGNQKCRCPRSRRQGHARSRSLTRSVLASKVELSLGGFATPRHALRVGAACPLVLGRERVAPCRGRVRTGGACPACCRGGRPRVSGVRITSIAVHVKAERGAVARKLCGVGWKAGAPVSCSLSPSHNSAIERTVQQRRCACCCPVAHCER